MRNRPLGLFLGSVLGFAALSPLAAAEPPAGTAEVPKPASEKPKPQQTYASLLAHDSILLLETLDAGRLQARWAAGPLVKAWNGAAVQAWWTKHRQSQMKDAERETLAAVGRVFEAADGCAAFTFGPAALIEDLAPAPPAAILAEQKPAAEAQRLSQRVRGLRDQLNGEDKDKLRARPGPDPWQIEETDSAQLAFRENAVVLTFQPKVFQSIFKAMQVPPKRSMEFRAARARALLPEADLTLHIARNGMKELAAAGFVLEEEHVKSLDTLGFAKDSVLDGALALTPDGFEERHRLELTNRDGLLAVLAALPPLADNAAEVVGEDAPPEALELLPPHAALWLSLRGDVSARAPELAKALADLSPVMKQRLQAMEKLSGAVLAELLAQVQAPIEVAVVFKSVGNELPKSPPLEGLVSINLKDSKPVQDALETLAKTTEAFIGKEDASGGTYYFVKDNPAKPGWWLKGSRLCFASWSQGLQLALAALEHKTGTERLADRPDIRRLLASNALLPKQTFVAYADAAQLLELPYQAARVSWGADDPENKWPAFNAFAASLGRVLIQFGPEAEKPAGGTEPNVNGQTPANADKPPQVAEIHALTPTSLLGLLQAFRIPFEEAGW